MKSVCVNTLNYAMGGVSIHIMDLCKQFAKSEEIKNGLSAAMAANILMRLKQFQRRNT